MAAMSGLSISMWATGETGAGLANVSYAKLSPDGRVFLRSAPVQNDLSPAPVTMTTRISSSSRTRFHVRMSSSRVSGSIAFIASGRFSVTVATWFSTLTRTLTAPPRRILDFDVYAASYPAAAHDHSAAGRVEV